MKRCFLNKIRLRFRLLSVWQIVRFVLVSVIMGTCFFAYSNVTAANLDDSFANPPDSSRPTVWWRWINGNITKEGITRDLNEMAQQGIRGVGIYDVAHPTKIIEPVPSMGMMGPAWREMFQFTLHEAKRLGLQVRVSPSAGWGVGGPWIDAAHATQALRWTEIQADGPVHLDCILPKIPGSDAYYRDVAVIAFPERPRRPIMPLSITASSTVGGYQGEENWPAESVADGDPQTHWKAAAAPTKDKPEWIELRYANRLNASSAFIMSSRESGPKTGELQVSDDGREFRRVIQFELEKGEARRIEFPPTSASIFRLLISEAYTRDVRVAEFQLLRKEDDQLIRPGIKWWPFKSANRAFFNWPEEGPAVLDEEYADSDGAVDCRSAQVVNLTSLLSPDGRLQWDCPPGRWTIMRFGAVILGESPRMASEALHGGYEVDPYNVDAAEILFNQTVGVLTKDAGELTGKTLTGIDLDSYEIGAAVKGIQGNWTNGLLEKFAKRHGYDPLRFLPIMARRIVDSREISNRFLWDYRQILAELYVDFYSRLAELAHRHQLSLWSESGYGTYPFPHIDGLKAFALTDIPTGEFWYNRTKMTQFYPWADSVRTAASAAHIYGRKLVAAEALTTGNGNIQAPSEWKTHLDREFCNGMNLPTLNCWSLQYDVNARPGLYTYDLVNENMTWWKMSHAFIDYLTRCSYLLQQGIPVADFCYFYGEDTGKFVPGRDFIRPELPRGYEFDGVNADVIKTRLSSRDGRLLLPNGISYRYLVVPSKEDWKVTPPVLQRINQLIREGATLIGSPPASAPGLAAYPASTEAIKRLAKDLWQGSSSSTIATVGRGRVISGKNLSDILELDNVKPDVDLKDMPTPGKITWCHRRDLETEIYFLSNQSDTRQSGRIDFRVSGKQPEFWNPLNGQINRVRTFTDVNGRTAVPIQLEANGSLFVVFRKGSSSNAVDTYDSETLKPLMELNEPWTVNFDSKWGGMPTPITFAKLEDWSKRPEPEIRFYSGCAKYHTTFNLPSPVQAKQRLFLNLGVVKNIAQVRLNGKDLGVVWTAPWQVEVTQHLKKGRNDLEIEVANLWTNRLLGDRLNSTKRFTKTTMPDLKKDAQLTESGLLGPVILLSNVVP